MTPPSLITSDLATKLEGLIADPVTYKRNGDKLEIIVKGQVIGEIPLGSGIVQSRQSSTWR